MLSLSGVNTFLPESVHIVLKVCTALLSMKVVSVFLGFIIVSTVDYYFKYQFRQIFLIF